MFRHSSTLLADALIENIRTTSPDVRPTRYRFEPIIGVLFSALEMARIAIDDALLEKLTSTIPDGSLFMTHSYPHFLQGVPILINRAVTRKESLDGLIEMSIEKASLASYVGHA